MYTFISPTACTTRTTSYFGDAITERYYAFAVRSVCIYSICVLMTNMNSLSVSMYVCIVLLYILLGILSFALLITFLHHNMTSVLCVSDQLFRVIPTPLFSEFSQFDHTHLWSAKAIGRRRRIHCACRDSSPWTPAVDDKLHETVVICAHVWRLPISPLALRLHL